MEQCAVIKFQFQSVNIAMEVYQDLKNLYGDDCLSCAQVFWWSAQFQEGSDSLEDDPRPGWPVSACFNENVEKVCATVMQDRWITTRLLVECLGVGTEQARQILERDVQRTEIFFEVCAALWSSFLLPNWSVWSSIPPTPQSWHRQTFLPSWGETGTKRTVFQWH
jgi:hypothetical protein